MPLHRGEHHRSRAHSGPGRERRLRAGARGVPAPDEYGAGAARRGAGERPGGGPDPRRTRTAALAGIVACAVVLPFAVASAGPAGETLPPVREPAAAAGDGVDGKAPGTRPPRTAPLGLGASTAVRCGPELTSPGGLPAGALQAQTCVLVQARETWARAYYRNTTGGPLRLVLSLLGPGGRTLQMRCAVGAADEPGMCETPRRTMRGEPSAYSAVAEYAAPADAAGSGPLLLRAGSNSPD
ncbi:hypothetical protein ACFY4K_09850 [Streptomyces leeuwenhoekii]|uniref:hypothetical protein n=1 Tax=Streptomyces leeuwenhoekii TaxID=1437453 RepID=UPI0036A8AC7F